MGEYNYNLEKLIRIVLKDFSKSGRYTYKEEKRSWFFNIIKQEEGIHQHWTYREDVLKEAPENHTLKDDVVYENPEVVLNYEHGYSHTYCFKTLDEAKIFRDEIKGKRQTTWFDS